MDAHTALLTLCEFAYVTLPFGIATAATIRVGNTLGAGKGNLARRSGTLIPPPFFFFFPCLFVCLLACFFCLFFLPPFFWFQSGPAVYCQHVVSLVHSGLYVYGQIVCSVQTCAPLLLSGAKSGATGWAEARARDM